jgi:hypothetical protein
MYDDGNELDRVQYDLDFEESIQYRKNSKDKEKAPIGFKFASL